MFGGAGLKVTTNGILWDYFLMDVSNALLRGIRRTFSTSSLTKRCLYPLLLSEVSCECTRAYFEEPI